jgi:membrane-bound lytic murein transglycosylase D
VGDELIVPVAASGSTGEQHYKLRRGDTLVTVADRFGVTVEQLRSWNHLQSTTMTPGRTIFVAEPVRLAPSVRASRREHGRANATAHGRSSQRGAGSGKKSTTAARTPAKKKKS